MILKNYEIRNLDFNKNKLILFYGKNEGHKNEAIDYLIKNKNEINNYDEKEILDNKDSFLENILSKSLFDSEKKIIIKRATDKILQIIEEISTKNLDDIVIIINADNLEKKSKLRSTFEKSKSLICVAFYPDNEQTLIKLTYNFLKDRKISISSAVANSIVNKCNGDRENLINELMKLEFFCKNGKKITSENVAKLTNLSENHSATALVDNCLAKNKSKTINILNENNFSNEDCILITRTFLNKSKKILRLSKEYKNKNNIDVVISSAKPPIFWKDKEITKQQIYKWSPENLKKLIYKLNEIELLIKKNLNNSIHLITDFILDQSSSNTSNSI